MTLIWADRLAIAAAVLAILFMAILSAGSAFGAPLHMLEVAALFGFVVWLVGRAADFVFTGRLR